MIYTRNYGRPSSGGTGYSPPPGYDGNAFPPTPEVKLHAAEDDVSELRRKREPVRELPEEKEDLFENSADSEPEVPENAGSARPQNPPEPDFGAEPGKLPPPENVPVLSGGIDAVEALFRHLRGKFGREELIIVLVMLLISSEGASLELMLLALILIAG